MSMPGHSFRRHNADGKDDSPPLRTKGRLIPIICHTPLREGGLKPRSPLKTKPDILAIVDSSFRPPYVLHIVQRQCRRRTTMGWPGVWQCRSSLYQCKHLRRLLRGTWGWLHSRDPHILCVNCCRSSPPACQFTRAPTTLFKGRSRTERSKKFVKWLLIIKIDFLLANIPGSGLRIRIFEYSTTFKIFSEQTRTGEVVWSKQRQKSCHTDPLNWNFVKRRMHLIWCSGFRHNTRPSTCLGVAWRKYESWKIFTRKNVPICR
jgi:hypothetical protein